MNYSEIIIGHRVLVQSGAEVREHAQVKGINKENGLVIIRLSNNEITEIHPQFILKDFGA